MAQAFESLKSPAQRQSSVFERIANEIQSTSEIWTGHPSQWVKRSSASCLLL